MISYSDYIRLQFQKQEEERDKGLTAPKDVKAWRDIPYGTDVVQLLDIYKPLGSDEEYLPVIVNVHGGGFVYGNKEGYQYYCMELARSGFAVISFNYHLAPEYKFPAPLMDTALVFSWVLDHSAEYMLDTKNIFGFSDSAGSNILLGYYGLCLNKELRRSLSVEIGNYPYLNALVCNCGVYRIEMNNKKDQLSFLLAKEYLERSETEQDIKCLDVTQAITKDFPPLFISTGTGDFLSYQTGVLTAVLLENCVPFQFHSYGDSENTLGHVFNADIRSEFAKKCNMDEIAFVKSLIKG